VPLTLPAFDWDRIGLAGSAVIGLIVGLAMIAGVTPLPGDAAVYWLARPGDVAVGVYGYPPPLVQLLEPLRWIDAWQVYVVGWMVLCFASLGYILGRWAFVAIAVAVPGSFLPWMEPVTGPISSVLMGNVTLPMVAAMVAATRHPALWAVPILTKITPGVGLLWFAFRGEWRALAVGSGVPLAVVAVSFALSPDAWIAFVRFALANSGADVNGPPIVGPPLWLRIPAAVLLIAWGARTNRPRVLPLAGALAVIGLYGWGTITAIAVGSLAVRRRTPGS
jgi:hypothetical protein